VSWGFSPVYGGNRPLRRGPIGLSRRTAGFRAETIGGMGDLVRYPTSAARVHRSPAVVGLMITRLRILCRVPDFSVFRYRGVGQQPVAIGAR